METGDVIRVIGCIGRFHKVINEEKGDATALLYNGQLMGFNVKYTNFEMYEGDIDTVLSSILPERHYNSLKILVGKNSDWSAKWTTFTDDNVAGAITEYSIPMVNYLVGLKDWMALYRSDLPDIPMKPHDKGSILNLGDERLIYKDLNAKVSIDSAGFGGVIVAGYLEFEYQELLEKFTFEDGTPCGQLID